MSEPIPGNYEGYRMFQVVGNRLHSIAKDYEYVPGVNVAMCASRRTHDKIPAKGCGCGFWLYHREYRARRQFSDDLAPPARTGIYGAYGDFGDDEVEPRYVLGKVNGGGHAIIGSDGCRVAEVKVEALVTEEPQAFADVLEFYGIDAIAPRSRSEEGVTTACVVEIEGETITLDLPDPNTTEEVGVFLVEAGVRAPQVGTYVTAMFERRGALRCITEFRRGNGREA